MTIGEVNCLFVFKFLFLILIIMFNPSKSIKEISRSSAVALVTGATDGIGLFTATQLARTHIVLLHGRDEKKLEKSSNHIKALVPDAELCLLNYDFSSIEAVKQCCDFISSKIERLDILINNAGVFVPTTEEIRTVDGLELTFQVNVVAPYIVNCKLLPLLKKTRASRVINVSSISQGGSILDPAYFPFPFPSTLPNERNRFDNHGAYSHSKLCIAALSHEIAQRITPEDALVLSCDPGTVNTKMLLSGWGRCGIEVEDATDEFTLATSKFDPSSHGNYYNNCRISRCSRDVYDAKARDQLWTRLEELTGIRFIA